MTNKKLPPYVIKKKSGYYFQPNAKAVGLGFRPEPLGPDQEAAIAKGWALYNQIVAEREARLVADLQFRKNGYDGTFQHLADIYRGCPARGFKPSLSWHELSQGSREDYDGYIDNTILPMWGTARVAAITAEAIAAVRDGMRSTPYAANYCLAVISAMLSVAVENQSLFSLSTNPALAVRRLGKKSGVKPRDMQWTYGAQRAFLLKALLMDWELFVAYHLHAFTGQRLGDVLKMQESDYDGQMIKVHQDKTDKKMAIPVHYCLRRVLDHHLKKRKKNGRTGGTLLKNESGGKFSARHFATRWYRIEIAAKLRPAPEKDTNGRRIKKTAKDRDYTLLQRRDLRRTAVIRMAEAGCTLLQIASVTGHSPRGVLDIIRVYWKSTYPQAQEAIQKLENYKPNADDINFKALLDGAALGVGNR
jgi:Phage integrase family